MFYTRAFDTDVLTTTESDNLDTGVGPGKQDYNVFDNTHVNLFLYQNMYICLSRPTSHSFLGDEVLCSYPIYTCQIFFLARSIVLAHTLVMIVYLIFCGI